MKRVNLTVLMTLIMTLGAAGCQQEGSAEKAGKAMDNAADQAGQAMNKAKNKAGEKMNQVGKKMQDNGGQ